MINLQEFLHVSEQFIATVWLFPGLTSIFLGLMLLSATLLMWQRRQKVSVIDRAVSLTMQATGIPPYRRSLPQLAQELDRARRRQHPLTAIVLSLQSDSVLEQKRALVFQLAVRLVGTRLRDAFRASDIVTYDSINDQYVILLIESSKSQALQAVCRLSELFTQTAVHFKVGMAEFPTDGLTIEDLVTGAQVDYVSQPAAENPFGLVAASGNGNFKLGGSTVPRRVQ